MQLIPRQPPGHKSRKARAFSAEIRHLRALGYSNEAIREALADVGVHVSRSTVQREASRSSGEVGDNVQQNTGGQTRDPPGHKGPPGTATSNHSNQGE